MFFFIPASSVASSKTSDVLIVAELEMLLKTTLLEVPPTRDSRLNSNNMIKDNITRLWHDNNTINVCRFCILKFMFKIIPKNYSPFILHFHKYLGSFGRCFLLLCTIETHLRWEGYNIALLLMIETSHLLRGVPNKKV